MGVRWQVAQLAVLALHAQMRNAPALFGKIEDPQLGQLFAPEAVVLQH